MESYPRLLTEHLLLSMKNGSARARVLFPRLIEIVEQHPRVSDIFISTVSSALLFFLYFHSLYFLGC